MLLDLLRFTITTATPTTATITTTTAAAAATTITFRSVLVFRYFNLFIQVYRIADYDV